MRKEKISPRKKRIGAKCNITPLLCPRQLQGYLELICVVCRFIVKVIPCFIGYSIIDISQRRGMAIVS